VIVRLLLLVGAALAGLFAFRRRRAAQDEAAARDAAEGTEGSPPAGVTPEAARGLVEAVLGQRPERRPLTIDFAPATATTWELLIDGPTFFPRMRGDIEAATSDVHIIIFGFKAGEIGNRFRDLLIRKVGEGVPVRLMVEGAYSQPGLGSKSLYRELTEGGVQVVANQGGFLDLDGLLGQRHIDWRFDDFGHFDHRKIVVVDGRVAFVGGPGIEDHYNDERFHDIMLRVEGPIVSQLQAVFLLSWHFQGGPLPETAAGLDRFFPAQPDAAGVQMQILLNNPGEKHLPIARAFQAAIDGATKRLYVINPYLAERSILEGIVAAGRRGADVRVIVPADPKSFPAKAAVRAYFPALHAAGVDVREHPSMAHAKVVLADDTVLAGTANLDGLSLRRNWELQLRISDAQVADHVAKELFDRDLLIAVAARIPTERRELAVNRAVSAFSRFL
jgi:cardiolipin synthase A/B